MTKNQVFLFIWNILQTLLLQVCSLLFPYNFALGERAEVMDPSDAPSESGDEARPGSPPSGMLRLVGTTSRLTRSPVRLVGGTVHLRGNEIIGVEGDVRQVGGPPIFRRNDLALRRQAMMGHPLSSFPDESSLMMNPEHLEPSQDPHADQTTASSNDHDNPSPQASSLQWTVRARPVSSPESSFATVVSVPIEETPLTHPLRIRTDEEPRREPIGVCPVMPSPPDHRIMEQELIGNVFQGRVRNAAAVQQYYQRQREEEEQRWRMTYRRRPSTQNRSEATRGNFCPRHSQHHGDGSSRENRDGRLESQHHAGSTHRNQREEEQPVTGNESGAAGEGRFCPRHSSYARRRGDRSSRENRDTSHRSQREAIAEDENNNDTSTNHNGASASAANGPNVHRHRHPSSSSSSSDDESNASTAQQPPRRTCSHLALMLGLNYLLAPPFPPRGPSANEGIPLPPQFYRLDQVALSALRQSQAQPENEDRVSNDEEHRHYYHAFHPQHQERENVQVQGDDEFEEFAQLNQVPVGLSASEVESLCPAREVADLSQDQGSAGRERAMCCICLEHVEAGQIERVLPCSHRLHRDCVDPWLQSHVQCPVCRCDVRAGNQE